MALAYVTVTGTWDDGSGQAVTGTVTFTPSATVYSAGQQVVTPAAPVSCPVVNGLLVTASGGPVRLLATDNTGLSIIGHSGFWFWTVAVNIGGGSAGKTDTFSFFLPYSGSPVDLYSLANQVLSDFPNPLAALGDLMAGGAGGSPVRLPGNATSAREFLVSQGTGTAAQSPAWGALQAGDIPALPYAPQTSGSSLLKGNGSGGFAAASAGTDYLAPDGNGSALTGITPGQVGAASTGALTTEATTRADADTTLSTAIGNETTRAEAAEALLAPQANPALTGVASVTGNNPQVDVRNDDSAQFSTASVHLWSSASTLGNQGGLALEAGIANSGATQGYAQVSQLDHTGSFVDSIAYVDLNGQTVTLNLPLSAPTAAAGTDTTQVATTAFVQAAAKYVPANGVTVLVPAPTGSTATDTPHVTAAITSLTTALASGPATLLFQDGTYQVDSNSAVIRSVSNFAVRSAGRTVIQQAPNRSGLPNNVGGDVFVIADSTDFTVEGITFDGNRDIVAPVTALTATASSGQPSVTVASGSGARYIAGQVITVNGGIGSGDASKFDKGLTILSITPGGGSGGGDLVTFTTNLANAYSTVSATLLSDGFGPYAGTGAYLVPYQTGSATVAGRALTHENQQCGLHLLSCKRAVIAGCTARNTWESPFKLGTGFLSTSLTDGCQDVTITGCLAYHGFDQGFSAWVSQAVTVTGCVADAAGWAGICFTGSDNCTATGNIIRNSVYQVWGDSTGNGIVTEGGLHNTITGNVITGTYGDGIRLSNSPLLWGLSAGSAPTLGAYLAAATAAGTSVQVSASGNFQAGAPYSIMDGARTEAVTIASVIDSTHVTFSENTQYSHASGTFFLTRVAQETVVEGNTVYGAQAGNGISAYASVRSLIKNNIVRNWGLTGASGTVAGVNLIYSGNGDQAYPAGVYLGGQGAIVEGNIIGGGAGPAVAMDSTDHLTVKGNRLYGASNASNVVLVNGVTDSLIEGNHISDSEANVGIITAPGTLAAAACARLTIAGNKVYRCFKEGIRLTSGTGLVIEGNQVSSCGGTAGIDLRGIQYSTVAGNVANSNQAAGILLEDNAGTFSQYNRVTGNTCRDDGTGVNVATGGTWTQAYGIRETGSSNDNLFTLNEADSNGTGQLVTAGAASYAWANVISGSPSGSLPVALGGTGAASAPQNDVLAGPASGGPGPPSYRALVAGDIPALPYLAPSGSGAALTGITAAQAGAQPLALPLTAVSGNASITSTYQLYLVNAGTGNITLTLPSPSATAGVPFLLKRTDNSGSYVTVNPNASELIDNGLHAYLANSDAALTLVSDGTNWWSY